MVKTLICKNVKMYLSSQDCMLEWFANWPVLQFLNAKRKTIMGRTEHWSLRMRSSVFYTRKKSKHMKERSKERVVIHMFLVSRNHCGWYLFHSPLLATIYSQECLCWADTSQKVALPCPCSVLPDKVCFFGGTYDQVLPGSAGTNDIIDSGYLFLFVVTPSLFC